MDVSILLHSGQLRCSKKCPSAHSDGTYSQFTASCYKGNFSTGPGSFIPRSLTTFATVKPLRNDTGYTTMRLTLAEFFDFEPSFCKAPLEYILENSDDLMRRFPCTKSTATKRRKLSQVSTIPAAIPRIGDIFVSASQDTNPVMPPVIALDPVDTEASGAGNGGECSDVPMERGASEDDYVHDEPSSAAAAADLL